jgi:hypothetical protein
LTCKLSLTRKLAYSSGILALLAVTFAVSADVAPVVYPGPDYPDPLRDISQILAGNDGRLIDMGVVQSYDIISIARQLGIGGIGHSDQRLPSLLWTTSGNDTQIRQSIIVPLNNTVQEFLVPGISGNLSLNETYPDRQVKSLNLGYALGSHKYAARFVADTPGLHIVRFSVDGDYSNAVEFNASASSNLPRI